MSCCSILSLLWIHLLCLAFKCVNGHPRLLPLGPDKLTARVRSPGLENLIGDLDFHPRRYYYDSTTATLLLLRRRLLLRRLLLPLLPLLLLTLPLLTSIVCAS